jgi:CubicO group peptidase (beta-lactamase class C family)
LRRVLLNIRRSCTVRASLPDSATQFWTILSRIRRPVGLLAVLCLSTSVTAGLARAQASSKERELPQPKTLDELKTAMQKVLDEQHVPGAGVALVSKGGMLWCDGLGKADLAAHRDVTCETEFRVGSVSKSFVSLAILKLAQEGKMDLNARVADVAPEVPMKNQWSDANPVRIANLLEHTAGFDDMTLSEVYNLHDPADFALLKVFQAYPRQQNVRWIPGSRFSYSNPGYGIAGYLVEKVTGEPYDLYIRENILVPLGITTGDFRLTEANKTLLAQGYENNPPKPVPYREIYLRPAGDMKASPGELAKFVQFLLARGSVGGSPLVKPEFIARMEYPQTLLAVKSGLRLGYGLANYTKVNGDVVTHGHDGGIGGFISSYRYMPEQNWGYVVLLNSTVSGKALEDLNALAINFLARDVPKSQVPTTSVSATDLKTLTGYYEPRAPRNQLFAFMDKLMGGFHISAAANSLVRKGLFGSRPENLYPVGKNLFRGEKDPEATSVFLTSPDGDVVYSSAGSVDGTPYAVRISPIWPYLRLLLLCVCMLCMVSAPVFALVWGLRWLFRKMKNARHLVVRIIPLVAVLTLIATCFALGPAVDGMGEKNFGALGIFVGTILFVALSVAGLILAWRVPESEISTGVRIHSLLVSLACCIVAVFLASWHLVGLRVWAR